MRVRILISLFVTSICVGLFSATSFALPQNPLDRIGSDVSWPNCGATPPNTNWGIIGVTDGLVFSGNPCVHQEASWFNYYGLYMNTGYPGLSYAKKYALYPLNCSSHNKLCLAYNFGYNAGTFALKYASLEEVHSNIWWLDVETVNSWTSSTSQNRAALEGMYNAIRANTLLTTIGFYSDKTQWSVITGKWQNTTPNWVATGSSELSDAVSACVGQNFTGGPTLLTQYTQGLDKDYTCSADSIDQMSNR